MKKILFPTEFSDHAHQMFHFALELARKLEAEVLVLHTFGKPDPLVTNVSDDTREQRVLGKLRGFIDQHRPARFQEVSVRPIAYLDYPSDGILKVAKREKVNMIVMGMTGKTDDIDQYLGSNALRVLRLAECPVLVIPSTLVFKPVRKVVFTTNFEYDDIRVLNHLRRGYDGQIIVLHVYAKEKDREESEIKLHALEEICQDENLTFTLLQGKDVERAIEAFVLEEGADLLAMTTHKRNLFGLLLEGSLTRNIARDTKTPLYVFKTP